MMERHDREMRELVTASGIAWQGKSHEECVQLVGALHAELARKTEALEAFMSKYGRHCGSCCRFDDAGKIITPDDACVCNPEVKLARAALADSPKAGGPIIGDDSPLRRHCIPRTSEVGAHTYTAEDKTGPQAQSMAPDLGHLRRPLRKADLSPGGGSEEPGTIECPLCGGRIPYEYEENCVYADSPGTSPREPDPFEAKAREWWHANTVGHSSTPPALAALLCEVHNAAVGRVMQAMRDDPRIVDDDESVLRGLLLDDAASCRRR